MEPVQRDRQAGEPLGGALDLGDPRQEGEHPALAFEQSRADRARDRVLDPLGGVAPKIAQLQRETTPFALDHRRAAHQRGEPRAVERRGHRQQSQIGAKSRLRIKREREAEITVQAALMHFVEQHSGHAGKLGIGLNTRDENALGHHRHPRARRAAGVEPGGIAKDFARLLAGERRHALRRRARRDAPGGEEQDFARAPRLAQQRGGDGGRLPRPRRRDEHRAGLIAQRTEKIGEDGVDREDCRPQ